MVVAIEHFLPELMSMLRSLPDPRDPDRIWFSADLLLAQALLMPLTHAVSRRRFNETILSGNWEANLSALLGRTVSELGAADTVNYLMSKMDPGGLESTFPALAKRLIRSKCLDRFRLDGDIMIAIDVT